MVSMSTPIYDALVRHNDRRWLRTLVRWTAAVSTLFALTWLAVVLLDWLILWRASF